MLIGKINHPNIYIMNRNNDGFAINLQAKNAALVTASDSTTFTQASTIYIGTAGNLNVTTQGGQTVLFSNLNAGTILPVLVTKVLSTSTTASNIVRLY